MTNSRVYELKFKTSETTLKIEADNLATQNTDNTYLFVNTDNKEYVVVAQIPRKKVEWVISKPKTE
jgi:hypothetical protein